MRSRRLVNFTEEVVSSRSLDERLLLEEIKGTKGTK